jgi:glycosyltransferase involved in cell wall biosynthesis
MEVIPNGVDVQTFQPPTRRRPAQPLRLLCVGRLVRQKGVGYLLAAMERTGAPVVARIVGDGPERAKLEALTSSLGLSDKVLFVGWVSRADLPSHYQWADVLVLPSFEEGMANVVLEALAAGLPVITTDIYANRGLIEPGRNGFLLPIADPMAIAAKLDELAEDPALTRALGLNARGAALDWSWQNVADRYLSVLSRTAGATTVSGRRG